MCLTPFQRLVQLSLRCDATHPMALLEPRLSALLRLAGMSPLRCLAFSVTSPAAPSGVSNYFL